MLEGMMKELEYSQARFFVLVAGKDLEAVEFSSDNFDLSQNYCFDITLAEAPKGEINNTSCSLIIENNSSNLEIPGIITSVSAKKLIMHSPLFPLICNKDNQIYINNTIKELISLILQKHNITCEFQLSDDYSKQETFMQRNISDYDFLLYNITRFGIFYAFIDAKLIFCDHVTLLPGQPHTLPCLDPNGLVGESDSALTVTDEQSLLPQQIKLRDYNPDTAEAELITTASSTRAVASEGCSYLYGENYGTDEYGTKLAQIRTQVLDWQRHALQVVTDCATLVPGNKVTLSDYVITAYNRDYSIINMQTSATNNTVTNTLTLLPADIPYRTPITPRPSNGLQTAVVDSAGGDYPDLNSESKYSVKFPFDPGEKSPGMASKEMRFMQPYTGRGCGMHLPLQQTTEVVYSSVNNDPNRPVIFGAVPNVTNPSPVVANNSYQNIVRTFAGNTFIMDDTQQKPQIKLHTKDEQNLLLLDATEGSEQTQLTTKQGEMHFKSQNHNQTSKNATYCLLTAKNHTANIENNHTVGAKQNTQLESEQTTKLFSGDNKDLEAKKAVTLKAQNQLQNSQDTEVKGQQIILKGMMQESFQGDITSLATGANIMVGATSIAITPGSVTITTPALNVTCGSPLPPLKPTPPGGGPAVVPPVTVKPISDIKKLKKKKLKAEKSTKDNTKGGNDSTHKNATNNQDKKAMCTFSAFTINCEHRSYKVDGLHGKPTRDTEYVLQVIAKDKVPDKLQITCQGACKQGNNCPKVQIQTPLKNYVQKASELDVYSQNITIEENFESFFKQILIPNSCPETYTITPQSCAGNDAHPIEVEAFAPVSWEGSVEVGYLEETTANTNCKDESATAGKWGMRGSISVSRNEQTWVLGQEKETGSYQPHDLTKQLFGKIQDFLNNIAPKLGTLHGYNTDIKFYWPNLKLSGKVNNVESKSSYAVETEGHINIGLDPLIGIEAETDVLAWIIDAAGAFAGPPGIVLAKFLNVVRKKAADGHNGKYVSIQADISIMLSASMVIKGDVGWKKQLGTPWQADGKLVKASIPIKLEGNADVRIRIFKFKAASGAKLGIKSEVGVQLMSFVNNNQPSVHTQFYFNGLMVYWAVYTSTGYNPKHTKQKARSFNAQDSGSSSDKNSPKLKDKHHCELLKRHTWPKDPSEIKLNSGGL